MLSFITVSAIIIADVMVVAVARVPSTVPGTKLTLWPSAASVKNLIASLFISENSSFFPTAFVPSFFFSWLLLTAYFMLYDP